MRRTRVYIAGPYSTGDPVINTAKAIEIGTILLQRGYAPYVPHLTMFWHSHSPQPYEQWRRFLTWLQLDFQRVAACDALLRLEGVSSGADREVICAHTAKVPVYYSLDTLIACERTERE